MTHRRTAYELSASQVTTPKSVVSLFWRLLEQHRPQLGSVLDLGAGDGRFAKGGAFADYTGVELDPKRVAIATVPPNGRILRECAFRHSGGPYDTCIGNPPYARHHDIDTRWKNRILARLNRELSVSLDGHCNLYLYFLCLGLIKTHDDGLVGLLIPYEWVSRPSARAVREHILSRRWNVLVYRFQLPIFRDVLTTASITVVDKATADAKWHYFDISQTLKVVPREGVADSRVGVLQYAERGRIWALRGLSPGSQRVFTLTESERLRAGLTRRDVRPCVTTLRKVPSTLRVLSSAAFEKHFVRAGRRCWLIKSDATNRSRRLNKYLLTVSAEKRQTYTCEHQQPWFKFTPHPTPQMLFGSGFVGVTPKVLLNSVGASAVGSVWGIHSTRRLPLRRLQAHLLSIDFSKRVVAHAKTLRKVEVRQLNAVLNGFDRRELWNGRRRPR